LILRSVSTDKSAIQFSFYRVTCLNIIVARRNESIERSRQPQAPRGVLRILPITGV